jgi:DNA excision repair protein ERCC-1
MKSILTTHRSYSLKYHRLHPEYIYTRLRNLQGKYNLRVMLTMVDIPNHEDALRELAKTSLVNNVTVILCWSAAEAARYLELYKSYEHASFAAIRGQQATSYAEKLVEFVTVPRSVNKADAVALVSTFGSLRAAINAEPEQISVINGWGEKKVKNWTKVINEPFRVKKAARRQVQARTGNGQAAVTALRDLDEAVPLSRVPRREMTQMSSTDRRSMTPQPQPQPTGSAGTKPAQFQIYDPEDDDDEEAMINAAIEESKKVANSVISSNEQLNDGVAAALAKLRETS